jgi:hypothetical protein
MAKENQEIQDRSSYLLDQYETIKKQFDDQNKEGDDLIEKMRLANIIRHDLETRLALQIDQVQQYLNLHH